MKKNNELHFIIEKIKEKKEYRILNKEMKRLVKDAYSLVSQNEFWVSYLTPNLELDQKKLSEHNFLVGFHSTIWNGLEPNEKLALLIMLDNKLVKEQNDIFTPSKVGKFLVGDYPEDNYFCKRQNNETIYYISKEMFEESDSYTAIYMIYNLQTQSKAYEEIEHKTIENEYLEQLKFNMLNPVKRTNAFNKFMMDEDLTQQEAEETLQYSCQPKEQLTYFYKNKLEEVFSRISSSIGLGHVDTTYEIIKCDIERYEEEEKKLIEKTYGKGITPYEVYLKAVNKNELER